MTTHKTLDFGLYNKKQAYNKFKNLCEVIWIFYVLQFFS